MAKEKPKGQDVETMNATQVMDMIKALRDRIRTAPPAERPALREELSEIEPAHDRALQREAAAARRAEAEEYARLSEQLPERSARTGEIGARLAQLELDIERPLPSRDPVKLVALAAACAEAAELITERVKVDDDVRRMSDRVFELRRKLEGG